MLAEQLRQAARQLAAAQVPSPQADALTLAAHVLKLDTAELRLRQARGDQVTLGTTFWELIDERSRRIPVQHLTGVAHFAGCSLAVGPGVFIPRPETELLAQAAISQAQDFLAEAPKNLIIVDLCTGSGAVAIALARAVPKARVIAVELSELAMAWAHRNVAELSPQVELRLADATQALPEFAGQVDVVVSNPPYIPNAAVPREPEVRDHDPELALYGGSADGLRIPRAVIDTAARLLRPGGAFLMEHAEGQQQTLLGGLAADVWAKGGGHRDLSGRPRFITARRAGRRAVRAADLPG